MTQRLYYSDAFVRNFTARVTDIRELTRINGKQFWHIALDRTAFYPTSGGQPFDTGYLQAQAPSGAILAAPITGVEEEENGEVWHATDKPLPPGTSVSGSIDWSRRFDHMQQHTGQHLLSAAFAQELNLPTVSFHLGDEFCTIDLAPPGDSQAPDSSRPAATIPSSADIGRVEMLVNEVITEDREVSIEQISRTEADALLATGALRKLPDRAGDIRLIRIANFDLNACGGTHVSRTGQIGAVLIRKIERVKQGTRVEFVGGLRAIRAARRDFKALSETGALLSVGFQDIRASVIRLQEENRTAAKERSRLLEAIADFTVADWVRSLQGASPAEAARPFIARRFRQQDSDADLAQVKLLARKLITAAPHSIALFSWEPSGDSPVTVILGCGASTDMDAGALLKEQLIAHGGRGGGQKDMAQGSVARANLDSLLARLNSVLASVPEHPLG